MLYAVLLCLAQGGDEVVPNLENPEIMWFSSTVNYVAKDGMIIGIIDFEIDWDDDLGPHSRRVWARDAFIWRIRAGCPEVGPICRDRIEPWDIGIGETVHLKHERYSPGAFWHMAWPPVMICARMEIPDDVGMAIAVEEMIANEVGAEKYRESLPSGQVDLLDQLGWRCYHCRERASRDIYSLGLDAAAMLVWGQLSRDPEARARSVVLWNQITSVP